MWTASDKEYHRAATMTPDDSEESQVHLYNAETKATIWSIADTDYTGNQLEREIYGITLNDQKQLMQEFSICIIEYEDWCDVISIQMCHKTIQQYVINFGIWHVYHLCHISESIWWRGSGDNSTTGIPEWLHIWNVFKSYWSSNKVNHVQQIVKHNDQCTGLDNMDKTL